MNYAKALRVARAIKNVDQQDLATRASLSKSLLSKIESQQRELSANTKAKVVEALGIPTKVFDLLALESNEAAISQEELKDIVRHLLNVNIEIEGLK